MPDVTENNTTENNNKQEQEQEQDLILGKFKSYEDLEKSYTELEKTHYQKLNEFHNVKKEYEALKNPKVPLKDLVQQKLEEGNGVIDYEEFKEIGYDPEIVDIMKANIEAQKALEETRKNQALLEAEKILGEDKDKIVNFTNELFNSDTFSESEKQYIEELNSNNPSLLAKISSMLYEGYKSSENQGLFNPYTNRFATSTDKYSSEAEYRKDIMRPEFKNDKSFRDRVLAKAKRSFLS
jgi:hypothetical protein